jgi:hypothetical protein
MRSIRITNVVVISVIILTALSFTTALYASGKPSQPAATYFKAPLRFEPNEGQSVPGVDFVSHGKGFVLHLSSTSAVFALPKEQITMQLVGSNPQAQASSIEPLESKVNYFMGTDPSKWQTGIPTFGKTRYQDIYPGIDVVYYGNGEQLEYDFVVSPGADPKQIAIGFPEARKLRVDGDGDLLLTGKYGTLSFHKPIVYQEVDGRRRQIAGKYAISNDRVRFDVGPYDARQPLIIDPTLKFSSYLGGSTNDAVLAVAADASSNAYVTGLTQSGDFPITANAYQPSFLSGFTAGFVTKLNSSGSIVFSTYFGGTDGSSNTQGNAIALDSSGNIYIAGSTDSNALPTKGGQGIETQKGVVSSSGGPVTAISNFVSGTTFVSFGSGLITMAGNGGSGAGLSVTIQISGNTATFVSIASGGSGYKVGDTITVSARSGTATFTVAAVAGAGSTEVAAFVSEFNTTGGLVNSTYVAGSGRNNPSCANGVAAHGLAVDPTSNVYITGFTDSSLLTQMPAPSCVGAFVVALNFTATGVFKWGQLIGAGSMMDTTDTGNGVALDASGNIFVTGSIYTSSSNSNDVFVAKLKPADGTPIYSVTQGGSGFDAGNAIAVDASGNAYVAGATLSASGATFITSGAFQPNFAGGTVYGDGLVLKLASNGTLSYGSYLGGSSDDSATGIGLDAKGNVSIIGFTQSIDFPVTPASTLAGVNGTTNSGLSDVFVARFNSAFTTEFYATYLGGSGADLGTGLAVAPTTAMNNTFLAGYTGSTNFASKTRAGSSTTGFVAMISDPNPAQLKFTVAPASTPPGFVVTPNLQVSIQDSTGAPVTAAKGPVTIAVQSGPAGATLSGATATASNGVATFNALSLSLAGSYTVTATDAADGLTSASVIVSITQPVLCFTVPPVSTVAGLTIPPISVALENGTCSGSSNIITQATSPVTLAFTPSGPTATVNAVNGVATFGGLIISTAGTYTVTATAPGATLATSSITITPPPVPVLCFSGEPVDAPAGLSIPAVKVALENGSCRGSIITQSGVSVTITIGSGASIATLSGTTTVNTSSGVATFSGLSINTVGTYTLVASTTTLSATSTPFRITKANAGIYVTNANCSALSMSGNSYTDSFDSSLGYAASKSNSHGDISVVGSADLDGNATVNGVIYTVHPTVGDCKKGNGIIISGHAVATGGYLPLTPTTFAPPPPVVPGKSDVELDSNDTMTLSPGSYGDIKLTGHAVLNLSAGTYNINSLTLKGSSQVIVTSGAVTLNVAGTKKDKPVDLAGGSILNKSQIPANFLLNYAGTGGLELSGQSDSYGVVYAPNADADLSGQGDWFGSMVVGTLGMTGKAGVHIDLRLGQ